MCQNTLADLLGPNGNNGKKVTMMPRKGTTEIPGKISSVNRSAQAVIVETTDGTKSVSFTTPARRGW